MKKFDYRVTIPGNYYTSLYFYTKIEEFSSNNTGKFLNSEYCYPEVEVSFLLSCTIARSEVEKYPVFINQGPRFTPQIVLEFGCDFAAIFSNFYSLSRVWYMKVRKFSLDDPMFFKNKFISLGMFLITHDKIFHVSCFSCFPSFTGV